MRTIIIYLICTLFTCTLHAVEHNVTVKYYNPVRSQCSKNPLITADGSRINLRKLRSGQLRWIAISRDLKRYYKYGDTIVINSTNPKISGKWVVRDTMNKRHRMTIDLLVHDKSYLIRPEKARISKAK